jgi:hypothetical protein
MGGAALISPKVQKLVSNVLLNEARKGATTKRGATTLVMHELDKRGGPGKFGIGAAELIMCLEHMVGSEVGRQLKSKMPEALIAGYKWPNAPPSLIQDLHRLPAWIAIEEGVDARWVPSLKASPQQWEANAALKEEKAKRTQTHADLSADIARYLKLYDYPSLGDAT